MSNDRVDKVKVKLDDKVITIINGTFSEMLAFVKGFPVEDRRYDGENKMWNVKMSYDGFVGLLGNAGFEVEGAGDYQMPIEINSSEQNVSVQQTDLSVQNNSNGLSNVATRKGGGINAFKSLTSDQIMAWPGIADGVPGMSGIELASAMAATMALHRDSNPEGVDIYNLTVEAFRRNIHTGCYYTWRDKDNKDGTPGKFNSHLKYNVAYDWIRLTFGNDSKIHLFKLTEEDDEWSRHTTNVNDSITGACLIPGEHIKDMQEKADDFAEKYLKMINKGDMTLPLYRRIQAMAFTDACKRYARAIGYSLVAADEMYEVEWEKGRPKVDDSGFAVLKRDKHGNPIPSWKFRKKARDDGWLGDKRATVALALALGDVKFPRDSSEHNFSVKTINMLADNPSIASLPDDNLQKVNAQKEANGTIQLIPRLSEETINLMRGEEGDNVID